MTNDDRSSILIPSNYSGACETVLFTNTDLLKLTHEEGNMINGPRLFALKYRILPCTTTGKTQCTQGYFVHILITLN
jgi:hypothetical protein